MVTVPASVWRHCSVGRALMTGGCAGVFFGGLALLDSGIPLVAAIVFVILGTGYGIWTARRMARYWPGACELTGAERVTVVRAARRGELVGDSRLARSVVDYSRGMHAAAGHALHLPGQRERLLESNAALARRGKALARQFQDDAPILGV